MNNDHQPDGRKSPLDYDDLMNTDYLDDHSYGLDFSGTELPEPQEPTLPKLPDNNPESTDDFSSVNQSDFDTLDDTLYKDERNHSQNHPASFINERPQNSAFETSDPYSGVYGNNSAFASQPVVKEEPDFLNDQTSSASSFPSSSSAAPSSSSVPPVPPKKKKWNHKPRTIEELKEYAADHNLPLDQMRFFIGENIPEPKAFGIYQDENGEFVVYKNKANGQRAIRYQGDDEAYAVGELYEKMHAEIQKRKQHVYTYAGTKQRTVRGYSSPASRKTTRAFLIGGGLSLLICTGIIGGSFWSAIHSHKDGYYVENQNTYFHRNNNWYWFDPYDDSWYPYEDPAFDGDYDNYYQGYLYDSSIPAEDFFDSPYYHPADDYDDYDSGWDDSSDSWDSWDSWDSSSTDWDSDW